MPETAPAPLPSRTGASTRRSKETEVEVRLDLDRPAPPEITTGLPFFDHMLEQLGRHGGLALAVVARGDLDVDAHHTVEDVGIVLGEALGAALGDKAGIRRFASLSLPLDEALIDVALDLSGRAYLRYAIDLGTASLPLGTPPFDAQLAEEFWRAVVSSAGITLHLALVEGRNPHHVLEASFKGVGRALRDAVRVEGSEVPSTKGML
ncbi:MAG TPA: imidazoleglycerol-phosphate dehydratase HisB [Acidimicrobiales bacterium]|nr:imidazoleglycerol-phosphate dehydratase HisB [Acidimicrobiales bacterium]